VETVDRQELRQILAEMLEETTGEPRPEVGEGESLQEGLGLDSVDIFSLIVEIQNKLRVKIASEELIEVATVGDLLNVLQAKLAATAPGGA
jgi:acyl carrier protein